MGAQVSAQHKPGQQKVIAIHSLDKWNMQFERSRTSNKLMVIDFSAVWCGPCKFIEPPLHDFAAEYNDVDFIKTDINELPDVAKDFGVQSMPIFILMKNGKECEKVVGPKKEELRRMIKKHKI